MNISFWNKVNIIESHHEEKEFQLQDNDETILLLRYPYSFFAFALLKEFCLSDRTSVWIRRRFNCIKWIGEF